MLDAASVTVDHPSLDASNLPALAAGCAALGAGGGGDPDLPLAMAQRAVGEHAAVPVIGVDELDPEALVMPCGMVGAPTIAEERVWSGDEGATLVETVERLHGRPVQALMPFQIGGANGLLPVTWAARLGLPLVDADGTGRAFPELQQQAMHLGGVAAGPVVLTDGRGNTIVIHLGDESRAEQLSRAAAAGLGGVCAGALYCMTGAQAGDAAISGSVSRAIALGAAIVAADGDDRLGAMIDALGATLLIRGTVIDVERAAGGGFSRGAATVQAAGAGARRRLRLELQNEFLVALEDGAPRAMVPDLISVVAADSYAPILTERLRYGQRVAVLASPAPAVWRTDEALALIGPAAFGYDLEYTQMAAAERHAGA
ncbi:MAG: uncharacterized protein QOH72_3848 [Solirubrobacteraceae bacterium]|jgi:DUF917 family protein|nr:uncharacterized protein [Solirubrobacteraceae bacterium]